MNKLYVGFTKEVKPPKTGLFIDDKVPKIPLAKVFDPKKHSFNHPAQHRLQESQSAGRRSVHDLSTRPEHPNSLLGEFGDKPAQGEVPCLGPLKQPSTVLARNGLWLVPTHLPRRDAAGSHAAAAPRQSPC
jgi:hypothetical protein